MRPRAAGRQRHSRRLQCRALLRGRRGALLVRRHVSDAESDRRQSHYRAWRLRMSKGGPGILLPPWPASPFLNRRSMMASETTGLTLANVLYEKKGSVAYITVNRPKVLNAL